MAIFKLTIPIYTIVFLGWWLQYKGYYNKEVNSFISFITYRIMLPLSIFMKISTSDMEITNQTLLFFSILLVQLFIFYIFFVKLFQKQGFESFVNSIRGNSIYLGFPVMMQLLPAKILPLGMVIASAFSPITIFGIEIVYRLNSRKNGKQMRKASFIKNPLIQGLVLGVVFNYFNIWNPLLGDLISQITKPVMFLSLIIVGANFNTKSLKMAKLGIQMVVILLVKLIALPVIFMVTARLLNFDISYTAIGLILFSTPGGVSNYVILAELNEASDLTINCTLIGTAIYLVMLPLIGYFVSLIV